MSRRRFQRASDARLSLLQNRSPPSSPSPLGSALQDSNVASLYPGVGSTESFESNSQVPASSRFHAQHDEPASAELDPERDGALQFVPAYEEASWDAIVDEKKLPDPPAPPSSSLSARAQHYKSRIAQRRLQATNRQRQQSSRTAATTTTTTTATTTTQPSRNTAAATTTTSRTQPATRISRLASLFSSRATVKAEEHEASSPIRPPASPANSGSSSGYIGWPGTQDKRGVTVQQASYDDSSSAATKSDVTKPPPSSEVVEPPKPTSLSAMRYAQSDIAASSASHYRARLAQRASWRKTAETSSPVASASSSAYMNEVDENLVYPSLETNQDVTFPHFRTSSAPTEERLAENDRLAPPHRTFRQAKGYPGLIDKTKDVPCLMDAMDSDSSSRATSAYSSSRKQTDAESDIFDGLSVAKESEIFDGLETSPRRRKSFTSNASVKKTSYPDSIAEEREQDDSEFKLVLLGGGLSAIQSTSQGFSNRQTASDYDDNLTNSEVDQNGFARLPAFHEMVAAGRNDRDSSLHGIQGNFQSHASSMISTSDEGSSLFTDPYDQASYFEVEGDLSEYYVHPRLMKKLLRRYKRLSEQMDNRMTLEEFEREEDEHKAYALFEMRSRIMEKDIERGLERRGGTVAVDDLVTTPYHRTAQRVRDACIVSKAWRDGASPSDVIHSALLTRRAEHTYFIKRPIRGINDSMSSATPGRRYTWEAVEWVDDTDFALYRCPSLGPRHMRGFEMFTVGDCQSILLQLTNEHCLNLRDELNDATRRQIEAEDFLHVEGDANAGDTMTLAEMTYLEAMEEVKTISKKLVTAEKAFALVRDRIQDLVTRYQALLVKIETESCAGASSIVTYESSYYSENDSEYWDEHEHLERERWARRAKRAEVRAELAAREALMAKQEARMIQEEKEKELKALQQKLVELQSEPSTAVADKEHSAAAIAKNYAMHRNDASPMPLSEDVAQSTTSRSGVDKAKLDGVKQRFRDRIAARKRETSTASGAAAATPATPRRTRSPQKTGAAPVTPSPQQSARSLFRSAGEEMYQHLDFYERSLKAVDMTHDPM